MRGRCEVIVLQSDTMALDHQLAELLARAGAPIARRAWGAAKETGLRLPQLLVLMHLRDGGAMSVSAIGRLVLLSPSATSNLVEGLREGGFVSRKEGATDRRQRLIELTPHGVAALARFREAARGGLAEWADALEPGRQESLGDLAARALSLCERE